MKKNYFLYCLLASISWVACRKAPIDIPQQRIQLPTDYTLRDIYFVNADTGYISAGLLYHGGQFFGSVDGGHTWTLQRDSTLDVYRFSKRSNVPFTVSYGGYLYYNNNYTNWSEYLMLHWQPWKQSAFWADGSGLLVGGQNFGEGYILRVKTDLSADSLYFYPHELTDIQNTNDSTAFVTGYGIVIKTTNQGKTWAYADVRGDFYQAVHFPSEQVGFVVGMYGSMLKTTDAGANWKKIKHGSTFNKKHHLTDVFFLSEQDGYIVGNDGVFERTTDGGDSWETLASPDVDWQQIKVYNNKAYLMGKEGQLLLVDL